MKRAWSLLRESADTGLWKAVKRVCLTSVRTVLFHGTKRVDDNEIEERGWPVPTEVALHILDMCPADTVARVRLVCRVMAGWGAAALDSRCRAVAPVVNAIRASDSMRTDMCRALPGTLESDNVRVVEALAIGGALTGSFTVSRRPVNRALCCASKTGSVGNIYHGMNLREAAVLSGALSIIEFLGRVWPPETPEDRARMLTAVIEGALSAVLRHTRFPVTHILRAGLGPSVDDTHQTCWPATRSPVFDDMPLFNLLAVSGCADIALSYLVGCPSTGDLDEPSTVTDDSGATRRVNDSCTCGIRHAHPAETHHRASAGASFYSVLPVDRSHVMTQIVRALFGDQIDHSSETTNTTRETRIVDRCVELVKAHDDRTRGRDPCLALIRKAETVDGMLVALADVFGTSPAHVERVIDYTAGTIDTVICDAVRAHITVMLYGCERRLQLAGAARVLARNHQGPGTLDGFSGVDINIKLSRYLATLCLAATASSRHWRPCCA